MLSNQVEPRKLRIDAREKRCTAHATSLTTLERCVWYRDMNYTDGKKMASGGDPR